ncbi:DNA-3-methyladenine glycosylase [Chryseobacterium indoltheticum]|uniref:Putative 3-methyladenine DNA glycosylase n=1 Tax=Chryseobacterium indoltheticum TaxID=254 RepID=A0A381FHI6_9FLAO|nr:DNA-3-methyladenine glycosylase [Chryseobacterium indoltheticum]SUX46007.1 3-methyladenine DNA glycosylase [Chryseobacterium indoltheticum]
MKLSAVYYLNPDVEFLAKDLLGKILFTRTDDGITAGIIVETEAYFGTGDQASHAYGGRRTARTEAMYSDGGTAYVYLCYGIHSLLNVVTSAKEDPKCVLIRSIEPFVGLEIMEMRRKMPADHQAISSGPGSLAKSLGIDSSFNKNVLTEERIWIEDRNISYSTSQIGIGSRIGIAYAQEHANLPLRFFVKDSKYVKIR